MSHPSPIAVLTGDIVGSTKTTPDTVSQALALLQRLAEDISAHSLPETMPRFTRFRGDGWQCYFDAPAFAPRIALAMVAKLRGADIGLETRIAIGIGSYTSLGRNDLSDAGGDVFERSGRALDKMSTQSRMAFAWHDATATDQIALTLLRERASKWSQEQAEAMAETLLPSAPTQSIIADRLGISPQAVSYRLSGAGAPAIKKAIDLWEGDIRKRLTLNEDQPHA